MTQQEKEFERRLKGMRKQRKYIALQLHPAIYLNIISQESINRAMINEGRDGKFDEISEPFYDEMVDKYDTRVNKYTPKKQ